MGPLVLQTQIGESQLKWIKVNKKQRISKKLAPLHENYGLAFSNFYYLGRIQEVKSLFADILTYRKAIAESTTCPLIYIPSTNELEPVTNENLLSLATAGPICSATHNTIYIESGLAFREPLLD